MIDRTPDQIKKDIFEFVKAHGIMSIAVQCPEHPWICTVYYGLDDNMNLYIVTDPNSAHGKSMQNNSKVAFNIFDSDQKIYNSKKGVQGFGEIEMVKGGINITKALLLWHKQNPGIESAITLKEVKKFADTKVFKITPLYLKFFNKDLYTPDEYASIELTK